MSKINKILLILSGLLTLIIFGYSKYPYDIVGIISEGAIIASFGVALLALSEMIERGKLERVKQNNYILFHEILKKKQWIRWSFLKRNITQKNLDETSLEEHLENPNMAFDVGSHEIQITLPTVEEDFFDSPVFKDCSKMYRYKNAFRTKFSRDKAKNTKKVPYEWYLSYLCVYDILKSACLFRFGRYLKIFSIGIIVNSIILTIICILFSNVLGFIIHC